MLLIVCYDGVFKHADDIMMLFQIMYFRVNVKMKRVN